VGALVERGTGNHLDCPDRPNRSHLGVVVPGRDVLDRFLEARRGNQEHNVLLALSSERELVQCCFARASFAQPETVLLFGQRRSRNAAASSGMVLRKPIRLCSSLATTGMFWTGISPAMTFCARAFNLASWPGR